MAFVLLFLIGSGLYGRIMIDGDGLTYYALTRSLVEDHDFDLRNQRQQVPDLHLTINPVTKRIAAHFSFGFGLLYAPFLYFAEKLAEYSPAISTWKPYIQNRILPFSHALALFTGSLFYGFLTLILCYFMLIRKNLKDEMLAIFTSAAVFSGTPLMFYVFTMPSYSHAVDAFLTTAAFYLVVSSKGLMVKRVNVSNILLGIVLALSVLLRNNNVVLIPPLVLGVMFQQSKQGSRNPLIVVLEILAGAFPFIVLLSNFNLAQYGKFFATGYRIQIEKAFLPEMLFHPDAGLFIWTPLTVVSLTGLIAGSIKRHMEAIVALACVLLVLLSVQFQPNWWGGCAFGPRFFTHLFVFWVWGLMECARFPRRSILVVAVFILAGWTFFLFNLFFINATSTEFRKMLRSNKCRRAPTDMIQSAVSEYVSARERCETGNPVGFWFHSLGKGRYPTVQSILRQNHPDEAD